MNFPKLKNEQKTTAKYADLHKRADTRFNSKAIQFKYFNPSAIESVDGTHSVAMIKTKTKRD